MLNLPEFKVIKKEVNSYYYRFTIQAIERPFMCTHCCWEELDLPIEDEHKGKKCGCSDFSTLENNYEEFYYNSGTGRVIKELECDNCRTVYRVNMEIEIKDVDMY